MLSSEFTAEDSSLCGAFAGMVMPSAEGLSLISPEGSQAPNSFPLPTTDDGLELLLFSVLDQQARLLALALAHSPHSSGSGGGRAALVPALPHCSCFRGCPYDRKRGSQACAGGGKGGKGDKGGKWGSRASLARWAVGPSWQGRRAAPDVWRG